jgi:hypothetical protein
LSRRIRLAAACIAAGVGLTAAAAQAAPKGLELVERPADRFESSIETHKVELRYREAFAEAERLDVAPSDDLLDRAETSRDEVRRGIEELDRQIELARRALRAERAEAAASTETAVGLAPGVSQATLDSIAACESGGDPTAVDASGTYYGKYQFDTATWASVGGSGSPAAASEAEQDYRASLLYSSAGSSAWPGCAA